MKIDKESRFLEADVKGGQLNSLSLHKFLIKERPFDNVYLKYRKVKPRYDFLKYEVLPPLDPHLLSNGIVMRGYVGNKTHEYYLVRDGKWIRYDSTIDPAVVYVDNSLLEDLYGGSQLKRKKMIL